MLVLDENDEIISISKAKKSIDYTCSDCNTTIRVREGKIRIKHFFHLNNQDCGGTGESLVHKYFKEYLSKKKKFKHNDIVKDIIKVELEKRFKTSLGDYIADVVFLLEDFTAIAIEVCYKNPKKSRERMELTTLDQIFELHVGYTEKGYEIIKCKKFYDREFNIENKIRMELTKKYEEKIEAINYSSDHIIDNLRSNIGYFKHKLEESDIQLTEKKYEIELLEHKITSLEEREKELEQLKSDDGFVDKVIDFFDGELI